MVHCEGAKGLHGCCVSEQKLRLNRAACASTTVDAERRGGR